MAPAIKSIEVEGPTVKQAVNAAISRGGCQDLRHAPRVSRTPAFDRLRTSRSARAGQENMRNVALARATISPSAVISASAKARVPPALITRGSILSHCPRLALAT